jgi:hypothetical protein
LDSSIVQGPVFCRAVPNPSLTIRNFSFAVQQRARAAVAQEARRRDGRGRADESSAAASRDGRGRADESSAAASPPHTGPARRATKVERDDAPASTPPRLSTAPPPPPPEEEEEEEHGGPPPPPPPESPEEVYPPAGRGGVKTDAKWVEEDWDNDSLNE